LKLADLVVGLPTNTIGDFILVLAKVTSLIIPSLGPTSSFLLDDSSIIIGTLMGVCAFPYLILVLFLNLKYRGPCLGYLLLNLASVPNASIVAVSSCSISPRDILV